MKALPYLFVLSAALVHAEQCRLAGAVFFVDAVDHIITIKADSDYLVNFGYDANTSFLLAGLGSRPDAGVQPEQLNNGDRLCVGTSEPPVVTVARRAEIDAEQKKELAAWQADSLYGVVSGLDRKARRITLTISEGDKSGSYSVDVGPNAAYWIFPGNTTGLSDAVTGSLDRVAPGDTLYIRGTKGVASHTFVANLVVSGGIRSFAATIEEMNVYYEELQVRLVLSGNTRKVHIGLGELYAIRGAGDTAGDSHRLYRIDAADLEPGDTVLIIGDDQGSESLRAIALFAGFSPFGVLPPDPSQQMRWIFDNVPLGDAYLRRTP